MSSITEQDGMLEFEKQIFLDILQEDGLVIAAKGLGLDNVIVNLLKVYCDPGNLVFVLGTEGKHQEWLVTSLCKIGANPPPKVISSEVGVVEREQLYLEGGVWFVPTRILVVDLIKKRVPIDLITGFIVCKAHNILKNHQDSFILRLFRQGNKNGFIKAFSNEASSFKIGFSKAEQVLKALFVRNLFLWPRYHAAVKSSLSQCKPTVVELHLEMSSTMLQLQNALLDLIKMSVQELKRLNPMLDTEEVTVENAISDSFHKILHSQLDPVWHALSERTKALLTDLKLFHYLIVSLLTLDTVSFYSLVNSQRRADCAIRGSGWHLLPSAEILFTVSRQRVFGPSHLIDMSDIDPEPNPKWLVLSEVLGEIHKNFQKKIQIKKEEDVDVEKQLEDIFGEGKAEELKKDDKVVAEQCDILILTREERTCSQLQLYLTLGSKELLNIQYRKCFGNKKEINNKSEKKNLESTSRQEEEAVDDLPLPEESNDDEDVNADMYTLSLSQVALTQLENNAKVNLAGHFEETLSQTLKNNSSVNPDSADAQIQAEGKNIDAPVIVIKSYKKHLMYLPQYFEESKPNYVIIYDSDMTLVRQLEVYQRNNPHINLRVYFLVYGGTVEEQAYLTSLRKEKEAFDHLIEEKARIVIPEDRSDCPELSRDAGKASETAIRTRKGGFESPKKNNSKIIVDMREFRSELPALIHGRGIDIEPLTITIGDYILTPDICLERKSVSDLIQSLNSGRLYNQALAMTRHYAKPMLLIEFDKDKPFDLQDRYYLSTDASSEQLVTKLQLLTLHFPQLRLVWSPSPHATAQLFEELKEGRPEPDIAKAAALGVEETATDEDRFNPGIHNFLQKLPGVTNKNIYTLLHKGISLDNLKNLSKDEISEMIKNSVEGEIIYNAFHKRYEPDESNSAGVYNRGRLKSGAPRGKRKRFH